MNRLRGKQMDDKEAMEKEENSTDHQKFRPAASAGGKTIEPQWDLKANLYATEAILCIMQGMLFFLPWLSRSDSTAAVQKVFYAPLTILRLQEEIPPVPSPPNEIHICLGVFLALCLLCLLLAGTAALLCFCRKRSGILCCRLASLGAFFSYISLWSGFQAYGERLSGALSFSVHMTDVPVLGVILSSALLALSVFYPSKKKKLWE